MNHKIVTLAEKLWYLLGITANEADNCEGRAIWMLEKLIAKDPDLTSALSTLTSEDEAELGILLWREIAANRAPRS